MSRSDARRRPHPTHPAVDPSRAVDEAHLEALAAVLLAGVVLEPGDPATLVRLRAGDDDGDEELELGLLPLDDGAHPLEGLAGFTAPADWIAGGVVATGRATQLDDGRRFPVRTVHLVARNGCWAAAWQGISGASDRGASSAAAGAEPIPCGRIDDALRRALGLATAAPPAGTDVLWATQWLDAVVERAASRAAARHRLSISELAGLHPAVAAFDLDADTITPATLVAEGRRLSGLRDWPELRRACAAGLSYQPGIDPGIAAWLDDGAFARWTLAEWPDLTDLRDAVEALLPPATMAVVDAALASWDLGDAA